MADVAVCTTDSTLATKAVPKEGEEVPSCSHESDQGAEKRAGQVGETKKHKRQKVEYLSEVLY